MPVIWKYPLPEAPGEFTLELPHGFNIISAGLDPRGKPCVWVLLDQKEETHTRKFKLIFTGQEIDDSKQRTYQGWVYVVPCTYQYNGFVFHLLWWN